MYRVNVLTTGKRDDVKTGYRYCLRKKEMIDLLRFFFLDLDCDVKVEKFIHIHDTIFA